MDKQTIIDRLDIKAYYTSELPSIKWNGSGMAQALCPFHEDTKPSLSINLHTGQFKCFSCDSKGSLFDFYMKRQGVDYKTAFNALAKEAGLTTEAQKRIVKTYDYTDESGKLFFQTIRYEPKDFKQRRPDGKGEWIYNLQGVQLVPYNLPEVIKTKSVIVCEGEKDVETLSAIGLTASCNPMGAGKWRPEYNQHFKDKRIVIIPDADKAGRGHALQVARNLKGIAESVKVIELPGLPEKGDITKWLAQGETKEKLIEIIKNTPEWEQSNSPDIYAGLKDYSELEPITFLKRGSDLQMLKCNIEWCIEGLLPKQSITLLHGKGGIGKTWLSLVLADAICRGNEFMGLSIQKMPVIFVDFENSLPVLIDRVRKIGIEDVFFWHGTNEIMRPIMLDDKGWELYKKLPAGSLLIFDTLRASQRQDENDSQNMAFVMSRLKELRNEGFTILLLHHTIKSNDRKYKGSTAIFDLADHILSLHKVKKTNLDSEIEDDEEDSDCLYRFGTKDKTRYEPFHIFMAFDKDKGFLKASDPDDETLQSIHEILEEKGTLNTNQIFEAVKGELDIKSKGKTLRLLKKGEGKFWTSHKTGRAVVYESVQKSSIYIADYRTDNLEQSETKKTDALSEGLQTLDNSQKSDSPAMLQTDRTECFSACMLTEAMSKLCERVRPCPKFNQTLGGN